MNMFTPKREVPPTPTSWDELLEWHHRWHGCGITDRTPVKPYGNPVDCIVGEGVRRRKYEWVYSFTIYFVSGGYSRHDITVPPRTPREWAARLMFHMWSEPVNIVNGYRLQFIDKLGREVPA